MTYLSFISSEADKLKGEGGIFVQGVNMPDSLVEKSGIWVKAAGSAILLCNEYTLTTCDTPLWLVVEDGGVVFTTTSGVEIELGRGQCVVIPANTTGCAIGGAKNARVLWMALEGPLVGSFMERMNAHNRVPARQGILPSMIVLINQMVQVIVRHTGTGDAGYQLNQLLWAMLAAYSGQSVSPSSTLSHEIARVVDAMHASEYKGVFSLAGMAAISRMPVETFRKRFTAELGIPPLSYLQFLKMERAKTLLRSGMSVRDTGLEIGMPDPYHFSKQFKQIVGLSPTAYLKHVGLESWARRTFSDL